MISITEYYKLISALPVKRQAASIKSSNWCDQISERTKTAMSEIFGPNKTISITRGDLFHSADSDPTLIFLLKVFIWGYPRGMRGNHFENICSQLDCLLDHIERLKPSNSIDWNEEKAFLKNIAGMSISTYSKILYFMNKQVGDSKCLILDMRVISALRSYQFTEGTELAKISYNNALSKYPDYLDFAEKCRLVMDVEADQIEMFLFYFGGGFKFAH